MPRTLNSVSVTLTALLCFPCDQRSDKCSLADYSKRRHVPKWSLLSSPTYSLPSSCIFCPLKSWPINHWSRNWEGGRDILIASSSVLSTFNESPSHLPCAAWIHPTPPPFSVSAISVLVWSSSQLVQYPPCFCCSQGLLLPLQPPYTTNPNVKCFGGFLLCILQRRKLVFTMWTSFNHFATGCCRYWYWVQGDHFMMSDNPMKAWAKQDSRQALRSSALDGTEGLP